MLYAVTSPMVSKDINRNSMQRLIFLNVFYFGMFILLYTSSGSLLF